MGKIWSMSEKQYDYFAIEINKYLLDIHELSCLPVHSGNDKFHLFVWQNWVTALLEERKRYLSDIEGFNIPSDLEGFTPQYGGAIIGYKEAVLTNLNVEDAKVSVDNAYEFEIETRKELYNREIENLYVVKA